MFRKRKRKQTRKNAFIIVLFIYTAQAYCSAETLSHTHTYKRSSLLRFMISHATVSNGSAT